MGKLLYINGMVMSNELNGLFYLQINYLYEMPLEKILILSIVSNNQITNLNIVLRL